MSPKPIRHVLVVDDDPSIMELFVYALDREGYQAKAVGDGQQALVRMTASPPDLLILDLMMPQFDGFYLLELMQNNSALREIPVIVVTAKDLTVQEREFLQERTVAVVQKGNRTLERVREVVLQVSRPREPSESQRPPFEVQ